MKDDDDDGDWRGGGCLLVYEYYEKCETQSLPHNMHSWMGGGGEDSGQLLDDCAAVKGLKQLCAHPLHSTNQAQTHLC